MSSPPRHVALFGGRFFPCNCYHNRSSIFGMETLLRTTSFSPVQNFRQVRICLCFKRHVCGLRNKCQTNYGLHCQWSAGMERFPKGTQGPSLLPRSYLCCRAEGETQCYGLHWFVDSKYPLLFITLFWSKFPVPIVEVLLNTHPMTKLVHCILWRKKGSISSKQISVFYS